MAMLEGQVDAVIGVDTHRDRHAAAVLDPNGGVRATLEVPSDRAGHARLLRLADKQAPGRRVWALEGTGCYGAGLTRFLVDRGEWVVEIDRPKRSRGRHGAKSDGLDAIRAGREALARDHLTTPTPAWAPGGPAGAAQHPRRHRGRRARLIRRSTGPPCAPWL
jgi:transposase